MNPFIRIEKSLDDALSFAESPINIAFNYNNIQLLPNQTNPYTQLSNHPEGIELEDWVVNVVTLCGQKTDITPYFLVFDNPTDVNGMPQILWQITNVPFNFGKKLVYLEITQLVGETFYSSPFLLTDIDSNFTARFEYKEKKSDWYQSIQINTFFRQKLNRDELTTYYQISTSNTVSSKIKKVLIEKWHTGLFNNEFFVLFRDLLNLNYTYCNSIRFNLYEAFEIPEINGNVNYAEKDYLLSFNYNDLLTENINEMTLTQEVELIKKQLAPLTIGGAVWIWRRPVIDIPEGWQAVTDMGGKTVVGRLDADPDFGLLGQTGGAKQVTLTTTEMPPHNHPFVNSAGEQTGGGAIVTGNPNEGSGTFGMQNTGDGEPFSILQPYEVAEYIEWVGV